MRTNIVEEEITSKLDKKKPCRATDDFIRSTGNMAFVNTFLKFMVLVLGFAVVVLSVGLLLLANAAKDVKPLPIFVNQVTGEAKPVDWGVVDAQGEKRIPAEVRHFVSDLVIDLYTWTKYTVKSNLDRSLRYASPDAMAQIRAAADLAARGDAIARNAQGLCLIKSTSIQESWPTIKIQVFFTKKLISMQDEELSVTDHIATIKLKTVSRSMDNPHGLVLVEYSENPILQEEKPQ